MVTFRFYVVSTVAFFLALAVGVVVGSVLDGRIADSLQDRLDGVEKSLDETVASIDAKNAEIDRMERYIEESAPYAVQGRLTATATLVIAETGVEPSVAEDLVRRLRQADSRVEGVIWLDRRFDLADESDRQVVAELTGFPASTSPAGLRSALWSALIATADGGAQADGTTTTTAPRPPGPDGQVTTSTLPTTTLPTTTLVAPTTAAPSGTPLPLVFEQNPLAELAETGLVRFQSIDGDTSTTEATELLVTTLSGTDSTFPEPGLLSGEVATASAAAGVPTVAAAALAQSGTDDDGVDVDRSELVPLPEAADTTWISTVDDLERVAGRVATALALADLREGRSGRYGLGPDVDGILPPWQGP